MDGESSSEPDVVFDSSFVSEPDLDKLLGDLFKTKVRCNKKSAAADAFGHAAPYKQAAKVHAIDEDTDMEPIDCPTTSGYKKLFVSEKKD